MDSPEGVQSYPTLLGLGAALYAVTALTNQGIVAIDDYARRGGVAGHRTGIGTVIPAQNDVLMPWAYIGHPVARRVGLTEADIAADVPADCSMVIVSLAASEATDRVAASGRFQPAARFSPGPLEAAVVWLNPRHNARRGPTVVFVPKDCPRPGA